MRKRRIQTRSKSEFISEIKRLSLVDPRFRNYNYLRKIGRNDLLFDACKNFGGWRGAVEAAGFRPIQKGWTKKEILNTIREIAAKNKEIPQLKELSRLGYSGLARAVERRFGSWSKALVAAGFKPVRKKWTEEEALRQIKKVSKELQHSPSMNDLRKLGRYDLITAGLKFFSEYNNFLRAAGLEIVLEMNKWPQDRIIKELREIQEHFGRTPRKNELASLGRYDLLNAAETYFPCWSEALIAAGLFPNSDALDDRKTWKDWENLVFDLLSSLGVVFQKKKYIRKVGYPDVYIKSSEKIIEIKTNCSDNSAKKDIAKYLPYCKSLEVWYLFGTPFNILSNKVKFVGGNKILSLIKESQDEKLIKRYDKINCSIKSEGGKKL